MSMCYQILSNRVLDTVVSITIFYLFLFIISNKFFQVLICHQIRLFWLLYQKLVGFDVIVYLEFECCQSKLFSYWCRFLREWLKVWEHNLPFRLKNIFFCMFLPWYRVHGSLNLSHSFCYPFRLLILQQFSCRWLVIWNRWCFRVIR